MSRFLIVFLDLVLLITLPATATVHWINNLVDTPETISGACSLDIDTQNHLHVSYHDVITDDLKYAFYNGTTWTTSFVDTQYNQGTTCTSIVADAANHPHIAYFDGTNHYLKYAYNDGISWQISIVDTNIATNAGCSLALDSLGHPAIAYGVNPESLKYAFFNGSSWYFNVLDTNGYNEPSLALDNINQPRITYYNANADCLRYAKYDNSTWVITTVDTGTGYSSSLKLDSQQKPHISYPDRIHHSLKYADYYGGNWRFMQVDTSVREVDYTSLALSSTDEPRIAYQDYFPFDARLKYASFTGSSWRIYTAAGEDTDSGYSASLGLESNGEAHIMHSTEFSLILEQGSLYHTYPVTYIDVGLENLSSTFVNSVIRIDWNLQANSETIIGFNIYRHESRAGNKSVSKTKLNEKLITGSNPYSYLDSDVKSGQSYAYRLAAILPTGEEQELGATECTAGITPGVFSITGIYPQPVGSILTCRLTISQPGEVDIKLYDLAGRIVKTQHLDTTSGEMEATLDVSGLAGGVYMLEAESSRDRSTKRVVIAK